MSKRRCLCYAICKPATWCQRCGWSIVAMSVAKSSVPRGKRTKGGSSPFRLNPSLRRARGVELNKTPLLFSSAMPCGQGSKAVFRKGFAAMGCAVRAIEDSQNLFQQNTPLGLTALSTDRVEVTDPTHPLYSLSFPLIGVTVKQRLGRVCLVLLHPGIERAIPVSATSLASEPHVLVACRLSV